MTEENWDLVIQPKRKWFDFHFQELWNYRDLILMFIKRDFVAYYKQTILGPIWFFIQPIFTMIMFVVIFGRIAQLPTDGIPQNLFYLSGIIFWNYFAECLNKTSNTFTTNAAVFGKVYFPRLVAPISIVGSNLITFSIQFLLFVILYTYTALTSDFEFRIGLNILFFPVLLLQVAILGLGVGIIVSSLTTKYKDLAYAVVFGVQLWMYATPIVYPLSKVPEKWLWLFKLNPMTSVIESFKSIAFQTKEIDWTLFGISWGITVVVVFIGISLFNKIEKSFMDTV